MSTATNPVVSFAVNPLQMSAITALVAAFLKVRNLTVTIRQIANDAVVTVSNYAINASSVCVEILGQDGNVLPNFPPIECKRTGKFALPTIRSYKEGNVSDALLPYPNGRTAFDAALYADSHVVKQGTGAWLRTNKGVTSPVLASEGTEKSAPAPDAFSMVPAPTVTAPAGISPETGKDTAKLTSEIQGKPEPSDADLEKMTAPNPAPSKHAKR